MPLPSPPALGASLMRGTQILDGSTNWLWEDRPDELVPPGPLSQKPRGTCRPAPAWEQLSEILDGLSRHTEDPSGLESRVPSEVCSPHTQSSPSRRFVRQSAPSSRSRARDSESGRLTPLQQSRLKAHGVWRPASKLTLAQVEGPVPPGSTAMWRGLGLDISLEQRQHEISEIARHRQECSQKKKNYDRAQARNWLKQLLHRPEDLWMPEDRQSHESATESGRRSKKSISFGTWAEGSSALVEEDFRVHRSGSDRPSTPPKSVTDKCRASLLSGRHSDAYSKNKMGRLEQMMMIDEAADSLRGSSTPVDIGLKADLSPRAKLLGKSKSKGFGKTKSLTFGDELSGEAKSPVGSDKAGDDDQDNTISEHGSPISPGHAGLLKGMGRKPPTVFNRRRGVTSIQDEINTFTRQHSDGSNDSKPPFEWKKSLISRSRMRRLLERRKQEFAAWPPAEQARLRTAFQGADQSGLAVLDARGLRRAFAELGLSGRSRHEKETINAIAREAVIRGKINFFDFVFQLVPEVEHKLEEIRSPKLYAQFMQLDAHSTGRVKEGIVLEALQKHARDIDLDEESQSNFWNGFVKDFPDMYKERKNADNAIDFKGFQMLVATIDARKADFTHRLEKRIAQMECLPANMEALHAGELCFLARAFDSQDINESKSLSCDRAAAALLDSGVGVPVGQMWDRIQQVMEECEGLYFSFKDFLSLVDGIREEKKVLLKSALTHLFKGYAWKCQDIVSSQVPALMTEITMCKDCCYQIEELVTIVESCDKDVNEAFDMEGLVALISKVTERSRAMQRASEAVVAKQLGFTFAQVFRLRRSFAALTNTGAIGVPELTLWFQEINPFVEPTTKEIEALIEEFSPMWAKTENGQSVAENTSPTEQPRRNSVEKPDIPLEQEVAPPSQLPSPGGSRDSDSSDDIDVETALEAISSSAFVTHRKSIHKSDSFDSDVSSDNLPTRCSRGSVKPGMVKPGTKPLNQPHMDGDQEAAPANTETGQEEQANQTQDTSTGNARRHSTITIPSGNVMYFEGYMRLMHRLVKA